MSSTSASASWTLDKKKIAQRKRKAAKPPKVVFTGLRTLFKLPKEPKVQAPRVPRRRAQKPQNPQVQIEMSQVEAIVVSPIEIEINLPQVQIEEPIKIEVNLPEVEVNLPEEQIE